MTTFQMSERMACGLLNLSRSVYRYQKRPKDDGVLQEQLLQLASWKPRWGLPKMVAWLKNQGFGYNHKRIRRVYRELKLNIRVKPKKRLPVRNPQPLVVAAAANHAWALDFMHDSLATGQPIRTLNVIDEFNREALWIEVDVSIPAARVVRVLEMLALWRGYPKQIRLDNGPELISQTLADWSGQHHVHLAFIQPGKPAQNAFIERFNRTYREEVLDAYLFYSVLEAQQITEEWLEEYNAIRPHAALGNLPPYQYAAHSP